MIYQAQAAAPERAEIRRSPLVSGDESRKTIKTTLINQRYITRGIETIKTIVTIKTSF
jgi:hypothetical protein